jgi:hypothetical protein
MNLLHLITCMQSTSNTEHFLRRDLCLISSVTVDDTINHHGSFRDLSLIPIKLPQD